MPVRNIKGTSFGPNEANRGATRRLNAVMNPTEASVYETMLEIQIKTIRAHSTNKHKIITTPATFYADINHPDMDE